MVRKRDRFWVYAEDLNGRFKCNYCEREFPGGASRIKSHLAGVKGRDIVICDAVPEDVRKEAYQATQGTDKRLKSASTSRSDKESKIISTSTSMDLCQTTNLKQCDKKDQSVVDKLLTQYVILNGIPSDVVLTPSFTHFVQGVSEYGPGYKLPSYSTLQENLIPNSKKEVEEYIRNVKQSWIATGCTLMSYIWSDLEHRVFFNIIAYSFGGAIFMNSYEVSRHELTTPYLEDLISSVIEEIGPDHIVQFITEIATNFDLAGDILIGKYPRMYKTRCAAQGIQLLLGDIYKKVDWVQKLIDDAKSVTSYIYEDISIVSILRKYTNDKELKHSFSTRLASNFMILKSILNDKDELQSVVASVEWRTLDHKNKDIAEKVTNIIQSTDFWSQGNGVLQVLEPLVQVLQLVNSDRATAGYLYEAMERAKEAIMQSCGNKQDKYVRIWNLFEGNAQNIIHPIHAVAAFLNPAYMCSEKFMIDSKIKDGIDFVMQNLVAVEEREDFMKQVQLYCNKVSSLFTITATTMFKTSHPRKWWEFCGDNLPILQKYAIRILSQPCSCCSGKYDWSAIEVAQTKKINRLSPKVLDDLLHVRMNTMMMEKFKISEARHLEPIDLDKLNELSEDFDYKQEWEDNILVRVVEKSKEEDMTKIVLCVIMDVLLAKLRSLATKHIGSKWGKEPLIKLHGSLTKIQAVLHDADEKQVSNESVRIWLSKLTDVAYDIDNVLDELGYKILWRKMQTQNQMKKKVCTSSSLSNHIEFPLNVARRIEFINLSLNKIENDAARFGFRMEFMNAIPNIMLNMETCSFLVDSEFIGREHDVSEIVNLLISANNQQVMSVLPIVGMAGLGKTTLTKQVYNHELVKKHFDVQIWIHVTKDFNVKRILREIIQSFDKKFMRFENEDFDHHETYFGHEKYLLILDDVWNVDPEKWNTLRTYLLRICSNIGSKIIVTTRTDNVAQIMETKTLPRYYLKKISKDECWSIMEKRAFANKRIQRTPDMEAIGREIANRCEGLPLAASILGGVLFLKDDRSEWLSIQNNEVWDLSDNNGVFSILKLSFDHLPTPFLKQCIAYCSVFPKNYNMEKEELIQHWMAEGFLQPYEGSCTVMEDIGNMYFNILWANSLFKDVRKDAYGNIISCQIHDFVHDLVLSISKSETLILEGESLDSVSNVRHLFVRSDGQMTLGTSCVGDNAMKLRTLISENFDFGNMLSNFQCLRVLRLYGDSVIELPDSVELLIHLRLLHISHTKIKELPKSITKLYNLQILRVKECHGVKELPKDLGNLINLRHIYINNLYFHWSKMPKNMGRLTCLQTLTIFVVGQDKGHWIGELGPLKKLRGEIEIYNLENVEDEEEAKSAKLIVKEIFKLGLYWKHWGGVKEDRRDKDEKVLKGLQPHPNLKSLTVDGYHGKKFPSWVNGLPSLYHNLIQIKLIHCMGCEEVPTLGHLPHLRVLEIFGMDNVRSIGSEFYSDESYRNTPLFPALRILKLELMDRLEEWKDAELTTAGEVLVFPCLENLTINWCPRLSYLPSSLHNCVSLQKLVVHTCPLLRSLPGVLSLSLLRHLEILWCGIKELPSGLQSCKSLQYLEIGRCLNLKSILYLNELRSLMDLKISDCPDLFVDLKGSHSLVRLTITKCGKMNLLPLGFLDCLTRLKTLEIGKEFDAFSSLSTTFASLENLKLFGWPEVNSLPDKIQCFTALKYLYIQKFHEMKALPEWLGDLSSLTQLSLWYCRNLMYLPTEKTMRRLTKLQRLEIANCPKLEEACAEGSGTERSKIAHIPNILIEKAEDFGDDTDDENSQEVCTSKINELDDNCEDIEIDVFWKRNKLHEIFGHELLGDNLEDN